MLTEISVAGFNVLITSILPFINKKLMESSKMDSLSFTTARWFLSIPIAIIAVLFFKDIFTQKSTFYIITIFFFG